MLCFSVSSCHHAVKPVFPTLLSCFCSSSFFHCRVFQGCFPLSFVASEFRVLYSLFYLNWILFLLRFSQSKFLYWFFKFLCSLVLSPSFSFLIPTSGHFKCGLSDIELLVTPWVSKIIQTPSAPSNLHVLTGNCNGPLIKTQDGSQITDNPLDLFYFDSVITNGHGANIQGESITSNNRCSTGLLGWMASYKTE